MATTILVSGRILRVLTGEVAEDLKKKEAKFEAELESELHLEKRKGKAFRDAMIASPLGVPLQDTRGRLRSPLMAYRISCLRIMSPMIRRHLSSRTHQQERTLSSIPATATSSYLRYSAASWTHGHL